MATLEQARLAVTEARSLLGWRPELNGIRIGHDPAGDGYAVAVRLTRPLPDGAAVPAEIAGVPTEVRVIDAVRSMTEDES